MATLKQVIEHFKNAKLVRSTNGHLFDYTRSTNVHKDGYHFYCTDVDGKFRSLAFFDQFATIVSYKQSDVPTLDQLKEHFKDAEQVKDHSKFIIDWDRIYLSEFDNWCVGAPGGAVENYLWSKGKYSEIVSYKELDYTVKGTALPDIPAGVEHRSTNWKDSSSNQPFYGKQVGHVSYGTKGFNGEIYILHEAPDYGFPNLYMTKLSDIQRLAQQKQSNINTQSVMETRTITHEQAQSIIEIACDAWSKKLADKWGAQIVRKQSIEISEQEYKEMRSACTSSQHELFDTIFGPVSKFKVGDWVNWKGNHPITAQIIREASSIGGRCWVLHEKTHNSCHESHLELASGDDITRAKYKAGDWVYIGDETDTWESVVQLTSLDNMASARNKHRDIDRFSLSFIERLATNEEIAKAQIFPKGTPCLVRDCDSSPWRLAYSNGDGTYRWCNESSNTWGQVRRLDQNNLPQYENI